MAGGVQGFLGSWREEIKEGYDQMAEALGRCISW